MFSIFKKFKEGLKRTTTGALNALTSLFGKKIDEAAIDIIEQTLYSADFGYETANDVIEAIRTEYRKNKELRGKEAMEMGASVF